MRAQENSCPDRERFGQRATAQGGVRRGHPPIGRVRYRYAVRAYSRRTSRRFYSGCPIRHFRCRSHHGGSSVCSIFDPTSEGPSRPRKRLHIQRPVPFLQTLDFRVPIARPVFSAADWAVRRGFFLLAYIPPARVIAYVLLKDGDEISSRLVAPDPLRAIAITIACVLAATAALTWLGTAGAEYLPSLFVDQTENSLSSVPGRGDVANQRHSTRAAVGPSADDPRCMARRDALCVVT